MKRTLLLLGFGLTLYAFWAWGQGGIAYPSLTTTSSLPNGVTATTQSASDNSTKVATTAYADAAGQTPGLKLIEQHTASASSELDFTTCITSTYDEYQIEFNNLTIGTSGNGYNFQVSTNGGSSYDTGTNYGFAFGECATNGCGGLGGDTGQASIKITGGEGMVTTASLGMSGSARFYDPAATRGFPNMVYDAGFRRSSDSKLIRGTGVGFYLTSGSVNAFRIIPSAGNITSGIVRCYGVSKT